MTHPPGLVGVLSGDLARWGWFTQSLLGLHLPPGSQIVFCQGLWIAVAVNKLIAAMEPEHAWICLLADDHIFSPDMVARLLQHDLDVVAPLCCLRRLPYSPSIFREVAPLLFDGLTWQDLQGQSGVIPVDAMGGPGVLLRRPVIDMLGPPWFECMPGERVAPHEDLYFFHKCRAAGFQPHVDLDVPIGHILPAAVFPHATRPGMHQVRLWSYEDLALLTPLVHTAPRPLEEYHAVT